jgi:hypothetical protein
MESVEVEGIAGCPAALLHDLPVLVVSFVVPLPAFGVLFQPENAGNFAGSRRFMSRCSACCPFISVVADNQPIYSVSGSEQGKMSNSQAVVTFSIAPNVSGRRELDQKNP